jgi:general secretion pathway protein C
MERRLQLSGMIDRLPGLAEIALVVLLAWMAAGWLLSASHGAARPDDVGSRPATAALPDIDAIAAVPLFGQADEGKAGAAAPVAPSRLNIKLLGTVVAGAQSAAIVQVASDPHQKAVTLGEDIQAGVTLAQVLPRAIVIKHGGRLERIDIVKNGMALPSLASFGGGGASTASVREEIPRAELNQQLGNFPKLLSQARVIPRFGQGGNGGYMITNIVPGSLYAQAGLKNGDVIQRVNGTAVKTPQQAMAMYRTLQNASSIDLAIVRGGRPQQIHYDIR